MVNPKPGVAETVAFKCTACGKCCNSAPLMSLPELFHHRNLFVGCLGIRQIPRRRPGAVLAVGDGQASLSADDAREWAELASALYFRIEGIHDPGHDFAITAQALDYPSRTHCPALDADKRCALHGDRKPAMCSVVPFDAEYPDRLQHAVMMGRNLGEACIAPGPLADYETVIEHRAVVSAEYAEALGRRRADLLDDKRYWGEAVFALLKSDLFASPSARAMIPADGYMTLSIAPALLVLAGISERCRQRCLEYIDSQRALIDRQITAALHRKLPEDKAVTQQLRSFQQVYGSLCLEANIAHPGWISPEQATLVERYWVKALQPIKSGCPF